MAENPLNNIQNINDDITASQLSLDGLSTKLNNYIRQQRISGTEAKNLRSTYNDVDKSIKNLIKSQREFRDGTLKASQLEKKIEASKTAQQNIQAAINKDLAAGLPRRAAELQKLLNIEKVNTRNLELLREAHDYISYQKVGNLTNALFNVLSKIPGLNDIFKFDEVTVAMKKVAAEGASTSKILKTGATELFNNFDKNLGTATVALFALKQTFKADVQATELSKQLGISKDLAFDLRGDFAEHAFWVNDTFVTTEKLVEANGHLIEQLGVSGMYSANMVEDFSRMTKLMGLTVEQAAKLTTIGILNKKLPSDINKELIKGAFEQSRINKVSFDYRTILRDVAELSSGILVKFRQNPEEIAKAVVQAKALGTTLNEIDKIGESLLDWEQSISNELKAELITGRQINLEKARWAALTGDQMTLMKEISSQTGNLADFQKMNVIAQKSLAGAFGLSRDELSKMLIEQDKFNRLGDVSNKTAEEQLRIARERGISVEDSLYKSIQQQSSQEKFNQAIEKLSDLLGNLMAGPFGKLIDGAANLANSAIVIKGAFGALAGYSLGKLISGAAILAAELFGASVSAIATSSALTLGLGAIGIAAGIGLAVAAMNSAKNQKPKDYMNDGVVGPNGEMVVSGPKGSIQLNKDDSIIAGTNLFDKKKQTTQSNIKESDLTSVVSVLNEVKSVLEKIYAKEGDVYLDSKKVGTTLVQNSYKIA